MNDKTHTGLDLILAVRQMGTCAVVMVVAGGLIGGSLGLLVGAGMAMVFLYQVHVG